MSLTLFDIHLLQDDQKGGMLMSESRVHFDQACIINEPGIMDMFNVFWITEGHARIVIDFTGFDVEPGTMFFLLPGQVFTVLGVEKLKGYRLAFARDFYFITTQHPELGCSGVLFNTFKFGPLLQLDKQKEAELHKLIVSLESAISSNDIASAEMAQSYLKIFLIQCAQIKRKQLETADRKFETLNELNEFNNIIEKRFREWHSVKDYATCLNISPKSLSKKLAKYGQSPSRLIYDRIILEAKRLMYYSRKSVKEIAGELGFNDPYHFSRFFKTHASISPREFMHSVELN